MVGCCVVLIALSVWGGRIRLLMVISTITMTIGVSLICLSTPFNEKEMYPILIVAGLGIGGILVPASIISTIVCPDDLIATVSALTLSIRVIGGAVGYAVYFNVFYNRLVPNLKQIMGPVIAKSIRAKNMHVIEEVITLTGNSLINRIKDIPEVAKYPGAWEAIVASGRLAYADAYKYVYYVSIVFGVISVVASCFLGDIEKYMDDHVAVVMH